MPSRQISDLLPEVQSKYAEFKAAVNEAGHEYIVTCTYRSQDEQDALYAQGRTKPGKVVTWTTHSRHTEKRAWDIAILIQGKITWEKSRYIEIAAIAKRLGIKPGADFGDYPHFEVEA